MQILKFSQTINEEPINEELIGNLVNFFKGLWKKLSAELEKIDNDPNNIKEFVANQILNPTSNNSIFKNQLAKFRANKTLNDQAIFDFMAEIFDKNTGVLGTQGIGNLFNTPALKGDKMKGKRLSVEYIINTSRDYMIKKLKFDQKKDNSTIRKRGKFVDTNWLGPLKAQIADPNKIDVNKVVTWITNNIFVDMQKYAMSLREDDIREAVKRGGGSFGEIYKVGDIVTYKRDGFDENKKSELQPDKVGKLPIVRIEDDFYIFKGNDGEFKKKAEDIIGKVEGGENSNQELKDKMTNIANDKDKMTTVSKFVDFLNNPENKAKIDDLLK
jgi:hypothetical protein